MSGRVPWISVSICSESLPWLTIVLLIWKPWRQRQNWKWPMFIIFSHIWKQQQRETLESVCIIVYCLCHGRQTPKVKFAIVHFLSPHLKNAKEGKSKKSKTCHCLSPTSRNIGVKMCYHLSPTKGKVQNLQLHTVFFWTSRRREITVVRCEGIFRKNGKTQEWYISSQNFAMKDHDVKISSGLHVYFSRSAWGLRATFLTHSSMVEVYHVDYIHTT